MVTTWRVPMRARDREEHERASTPLELFVDLCFVVGVAQAASSLHHAVSEDHVGHAVSGYLMMFFAVWWAWMNFTWFASAFDTDDVLYRLVTLIQVVGVLVVAAGIPRGFEGELGVPVLGYVIMRVALASQWVRAGLVAGGGFNTCLRYALGIALTQLYWVSILLAPSGWVRAMFVGGAVIELLVPLWAERTGVTSWHPGHIAERYQLFTLIVLGEVVLASTLALQGAADGHAGDLAAVVAGAPLVVFGMWWIYFSKSDADRLTSGNDIAFVWGYGHYLVFGAAAAVGAGVAVQVDLGLHVAHVSSLAGAAAVTVPLAVYLLSVWWLHLRPHHVDRAHRVLFPGAAALVLGATWLPSPLVVCGTLLVALIIASHRTTRLAGSAR